MAKYLGGTDTQQEDVKAELITPGLLSNDFVLNVSTGIFSSEKIGKLAEITTEGTSEMASFMMFHGSGDYDEYEEWAGELYDVYEEEAEKITSAYLDSASSAAIDDLDLEDFDLGDFNLDLY